MSRAAAGVCLALALASAGPARPAEGWRTFAGSLSATGQRDTLPTEGRRAAAIVRLSGTVLLSAGDGLSRGFRCEAIGFDDGANVRVGRSVWTDDRGDRIFGTFEGEPLETGSRIAGKLTGGTGRYAGVTGEYSLTWQYVVTAEAGAIQGRATDLEGRYLPGAAPR